ncbi:MAG: multidrug efflux pump, partial [Acidobacteriota bacterium]|nr:multidrug efflux pump [Acidobacteriota bacterium]
MTGPIARRIATLALLVLGGVAFSRLPLDYYPRRSFPELTVALSLGAERDPAEVARGWVEPIESAVRSLGGVTGMAGEVRSDGADLTVRFAPDTDPERKAARLDSELARLRALLSDVGGLRVNPATEEDGDFLAIVWLAGVRDDAGARAAAEALRAVEGVRAVQLVGGSSEEVRVTLAAGLPDPWGLAGTALGEVRRSLRVPDLGWSGWSQSAGRRRPVLVTSAAALAALPIPMGGTAVPLGSLGSLEERRKAPRSVVRLRGRPARALYVWRGHDAPPLAVDGALRRRLMTLPGGIRGEVGWSSADPLRDLVWRLALAGLLGLALAAAIGAWRAGPSGALAFALALPAVAAAAANAFLLAGIPLDVTTLAALALATAGLLPLALLRLERRRGFWVAAAGTLAAAACVPVAVALASAELGPLLAEPAHALILAVAAGVAAIAILPVPAQRRSRRQTRRDGRSLLAARAALRDPGTVLLAATAFTALSLTLWGGALVPRPGNLEPDQ